MPRWRRRSRRTCILSLRQVDARAPTLQTLQAHISNISATSIFSLLISCASQENFNAWNDALKEKDFEKVAALYSSTDLSFLPTVSPKFIRDGQSTKEYFMEFLKKLPDGTITSDNVQRFGPDAYLHTGMYTFLTGPAESRTPVEARFSYMWRKVEGVWKIVHHHSSALPKAPGAAVEEAESEDMYPIAQARRA